ncbi:GNAT family N-acetyltransferase [Mucilaginibacter phyllosphaerae]|uniref:GNAT family N-acetyltransferase n=1 Tax=Mucilaginibacter phyllosphaerae TaxID=1812349 RepID=A0A4Y8AK30_9SPHI|nr:GNAT family N-acetyltransferase [Mucilaginibacter phyllosphaerae]MBB3968123.1 putative GNAT family acetyltransferase [Mucilaginibacter phyllosphaerae]TEW68859.1 GNAT family N-acetyltransferase [Mucilaginibacter phyllosphaerae]GGH01108.1 GNAT family N-acetyltransferase [Mucilaginibacter phyllosphaerae]
MPHVLDNPIYNALISGSQKLSVAQGSVSHFRRDVAPFAGLKNLDEADFAVLEQLIAESGVYVLFSPQKIKFPQSWQILRSFEMKQMIYEGPVPANDTRQQIIDLDDSHVPEMLALTQLTVPGPFLDRTIEFGNYTGIFTDDKLVAMAGQRMQPSPYIEISAVCTHPDHLGKGYAAALLNEQIRRIMNDGNIPFLHVLADNHSAIRVYERAGFKNHQQMLGYVCNIPK